MTFELQPALTGDLLALRPLRADDYETLRAVASDPLIWEQHPDKTRSTPEGFKAFFQVAMDSRGALVAIDNKTKQIIGSSRYHGYDQAKGEVEIGWTFLARAYWGGVYNREMKRLMLEHAFRFVGTVVFLVGPGNFRSQRAVEKIGGVRLGTRRNEVGRESVAFALTAAAFAKGPTDLDLMRLHVEAEFTRDQAGRLVVVNEPKGGAAPRFFLGRTADGNAWWFRHDVGTALARDLRQMCESLPTHLEVGAGLEYAAPFIARLAREAPVTKTGAGPAFHFPADRPGPDTAVRVTHANVAVLSPYLEAWGEDVAAGVPMAAVLEGGKAVSLCASVRLTPEAHEAGVETHKDFRGRGHAAPAVTAWAKLVRAMGPVPLYSTSWDNQASRALAKKLGLIQFGADLHIT